MKIITIDNGILKAQISSFGAELISVEKDGKQKIWDANPEIWNGHCPVLFPICGCLLDGYYEYEGEKYQLKAHGFASRSEFEVVSEEKTSATFLLKANEETKKVYPFDFEFRVHFKLDGDKLCVYYIVENNGNKTLYCNVGCHEAYAIDGNLSDYSILFEGEDKLLNTIYGERFLEDDKREIKLVNNRLQLDPSYHKGEFMHNGVLCYNDSIIVENIKNKKLTLFKGDEPIVDIYYADFDHLVIWTEGVGFVAIEPWNGLPDAYNTNHNLKDKKSIDKVEPNSTKTYYHSITFN